MTDKVSSIRKENLLSYKMNYNYTRKSFEYFCHRISTEGQILHDSIFLDIKTNLIPSEEQLLT